MVTPPIGYEELGVTNVTNLIPRCKQVNTNLVKEVIIILTYMVITSVVCALALVG
jgi:hypothetical protein